MAGRRRRKMLKPQRYLPTYSDLPSELLELILSRLNLKDNIRASAVCKKWLVAATCVQKLNKPPWLMFVPKFGDTYEFYDPLSRKSYWHEFPEVRDSRICCSKDGWLLLCRPKTQSVFFFSPYTREVIDLPKQQLRHQIVAFSAPPTSSSCLVVAVKNFSPTIVFSTCCPGYTEWITVAYHNQVSFGCGIWNKIVFCQGLFYCLSCIGRLGIFNPENRMWTVSSIPPPQCTEFYPLSHSWGCRFMAEHNGEIFVIYSYANINPLIYKLDEKQGKWLEISVLGGITLFANSLSSMARSDLLGKMTSKVYFCKVLFYGKRCVAYSPCDGRYYPQKQNYDWEEEDPCESVWIDAPEDVSVFFQR